MLRARRIRCEPFDVVCGLFDHLSSRLCQVMPFWSVPHLILSPPSRLDTMKHRACSDWLSSSSS